MNSQNQGYNHGGGPQGFPPRPSGYGNTYGNPSQPQPHFQGPQQSQYEGQGRPEVQPPWTAEWDGRDNRWLFVNSQTGEKTFNHPQHRGEHSNLAMAGVGIGGVAAGALLMHEGEKWEERRHEHEHERERHGGYGEERREGFGYRPEGYEERREEYDGYGGHGGEERRWEERREEEREGERREERYNEEERYEERYEERNEDYGDRREDAYEEEVSEERRDDW